jgi:hypothetical protein
MPVSVTATLAGLRPLELTRDDIQSEAILDRGKGTKCLVFTTSSVPPSLIATGAVGRVPQLRDDALEPHGTGVPQHGRAVSLDVLGVPNSTVPGHVREEVGKGILAFQQRPLPAVAAGPAVSRREPLTVTGPSAEKHGEDPSPARYRALRR